MEERGSGGRYLFLFHCLWQPRPFSWNVENTVPYAPASWVLIDLPLISHNSFGPVPPRWYPPAINPPARPSRATLQSILTGFVVLSSCPRSYGLSRSLPPDGDAPGEKKKTKTESDVFHKFTSR